MTFGYVPRSEIAGSYDGIIFSSSLWESPYITIHNCYANSNFHEKCVKVLLSPQPHQQSWFFGFWIIVVLTGMRQYILVLLFAIPCWLLILSIFFHVFLVYLYYLRFNHSTWQNDKERRSMEGRERECFTSTVSKRP